MSPPAPTQTRRSPETKREARNQARMVAGIAWSGRTPEQIAKAEAATPTERMATFLRLKAREKANGWRLGLAAHAYRETFGDWPRFTDEELAGVEPAADQFFDYPSPKRRTSE